MLVTRINAPSFKMDDSRFIVRFEIHNPDPEDYYLLKWFTPLEGLLSECLRVTRHGQPVPYDGRLVKRGNPTGDDFVFIPAGQSVFADVDLHEAYNVSVPGEYTLTVVPPMVDYFAVEPDLVSPSSILGRGILGKQVETSTVAFSVAGSDRAYKAQRHTAGEAVRQEENARRSLKRRDVLGSKVGALEPQFVGGDVTKKAQARQAHFDGYALCVAAAGSLANDPWYKEWFGAYAPSRFAIVQSNYATIKTAVETKTFTYNLTGDGCKPSTYAYTYKGTTTVWLCDLFWKAPSSGTDSKAGTIVHEHGHASALLDDIVYGQGNCRALAISDPDKAIRNADSHEYFAKG